jgi:DNA-directed RNA polymerase specialized sigma24 family protein
MVMDNAQIIEVYNYARKNAPYFERDPQKQMDLVHDAILKLMMHPEYGKMEYPKAYVIKLMRFRYTALMRSPRALEIPYPYAGAREDVSYRVLNYGGAQLHDVEAYMDTCTILDFVRAGKLTKSNNKGKISEIFNRYLQGYTHPEIAKELGIGEVASCTAWNSALKRIRTAFA